MNLDIIWILSVSNCPFLLQICLNPINMSTNADFGQKWQNIKKANTVTVSSSHALSTIRRKKNPQQT